ncbi:MAG TPA: hypothetical protein VMN39_04475, partial [Longimicrobiaceae bacterium]|nr:hypothetical protein [Longimicrobiaceae bacterium]
VPLRDAVTAEFGGEAKLSVRMHDGSVMHLRNVEAGYDPTDRDAAYAYVRRCQAAGEVATGVLFVDPDSRNVHDLNDTVPEPLYDYPYEDLCPGSGELEKLMGEFR